MEWQKLTDLPPDYSHDDFAQRQQPFDGTPVLVVEPPTENWPQQVVIAWCCMFTLKWRTENDAESWRGEEYRVIHPTHWMPLPELP